MQLILSLVLAEGPRDNTFEEDREYDLPSMRYNQLFAARLCGNFRRDCEYWLQAGFNPDKIAKVKVNPATTAMAESIFVCEDRINGDQTTFPLFQMTVGWTRLMLFEKGRDEEGIFRTFREVLAVRVYVHPPPWMGKALLGMMTDMADAPQFFLDDYTGQMQVYGLSTILEDGYSSHEDADIELRAVEKVLVDLEKPLSDINRAPRTTYALLRRRMDIERATRGSSRIERRLDQSCDHGVRCDRLPVEAKIVGYDIRAHAVIRWFLRRKLMGRCDDVLIDLEAALKRRQAEIKEIYKTSTGYLRTKKIHDLEPHIQSLVGHIDRAKRARMRILTYATFRYLCGSTRELSVFTVPRTVFTGSIGYERVYRIIINFVRVRCWWNGLSSNWYKRPKLQLDTSRALDNQKEMEGRWIRKYSIVYEYWCYWRLLKALQVIGFDIKPNGGEWLGAENGSRCVFCRGEVEVEIIHGFSARLRAGKGENTEFRLDPSEGLKPENADWPCEKARERTPDFALVFKNRVTHATRWIVMDAKSNSRMEDYIIEVRERYLHYLKRRGGKEDSAWESAAQSWILYSGDVAKGDQRVECPPKAWSGCPDQASMAPYTFSPTEGIVYAAGTVDRPAPRGHLRVNIMELGPDNGPFVDFIAGVVATMQRSLFSTNSM